MFMRIAHIITGLEDGGAEACLYRLCCADQQNKHLVISLTGPGKYGSLLRAMGVPVFEINMQRGRASVVGIAKLFGRIKALQPDVVQCWMYHANLFGGTVARLAGVKRVAWGVHHGELSKEDTGRITRLVARISGWLSGSVPMVTVFCAHSAAACHQHMGYAVGKTRVICNGYNTTRFAPDRHARQTIRHQLEIADEKPLIGMVARFDPAKNHLNLLRTMQLLRSRGILTECLLVGKGLDSANVILKKMIDDCGLETYVHLLGAKEDICGIMNAIDIHVLSSSIEAFPNVLAEAMACGTPCVATSVGDSAHILGDTGWLVPPRDPNSLAAAIADALGNHATQEWPRRQSAARQRIVDKFSIDSMVAAYNSLWSEMAARGNADAGSHK